MASNSTWSWKGPTGEANIAANWTLVAGPGTGGYPHPGDTAIDTTGTILTPVDTHFVSNMLELGGTNGTIAALFVNGDAGINLATPTDDSNTLLTSHVPGVSTAVTSVLDTSRNYVNEGTILANGTTGSTFTINIAGTTVNGLPVADYAYNTGVIQADAGNTLTINIGANSELLNAGSIIADGGTVQILSNPAAIGGGYAPVRGVAIIEAGGTLETNAAYSSTEGGTGPFFVFGDTTTGDTLKIDNIGSFGGRVLAFGAGDTIDLGTSLAVGTLVYAANSAILTLENNSGVAVASLIAPGAFGSGTFAVNGGTADGFTLSTGADGATLLTTTTVNPTSSGTPGTWQTGSSWVGGVTPLPSSDPVIGPNATAPFLLTTGSSPVSVAGFVITSPLATVEITSNTTATSQAINNLSGTLDVISGSTLTAEAIQSFTPTSAVTIEAGATLSLSGRLNPDLASSGGTLGTKAGNDYAATVSAGTVEVDGSMLAGPASAGGGGGDIAIGYDSDQSANVTVNSGGTVTDTYSLLGSGPTSSGTLTLGGPGASWTDTIDTTDTLHSTGISLVGYNDEATNTPSNLAAPQTAAAAQMLIENGATLTDQEAGYIADSVDSSGTVTVLGSGAEWNLANNGVGFLNVGYAGSGDLSVVSGGSVAIGAVGTFDNNGTTFTGGGIGIGYSAAATGTVTVDDGQLTTAGGLSVGRSGQGVLDIINGGSVAVTGSGHGIAIGQSAAASSSGTLIVDDSFLSLGSSTTGIGVGILGQGTLVVTDGGSVSELSFGDGIGIAETLGAAGTVIVSDGGIINMGTATGGIGIGNAGQGVVDVLSGGTILTNSLNHGIGLGATGTNTTGSGTLLVSGTGALVSMGSGDGLFIGEGTNGTVTVDDSGILVAGGQISIGGTTGSHGLLNVSNSGVVTDNGTAIFVGGSGSGTLALASGAVVNAGTGTVNINSLGTVIGSGDVQGAVNNNGTIDGTGGTLFFSRTIGGSGVITLGAGSNVQVAATVSNGQSIGFASGTPETFVFGTPGTAFTGAVTGLAGGDRIEFGNGVTVTSASLVNGHTIVANLAGGGTYHLTNASLAIGNTASFATGSDISTGDSFIQVILPTVTAGASANYLAGSAPVTLDAGLTIADPNSGTLVSATVAIGTDFLAGDTLTVGSPQTGIISSYNASTGTLTLTGTATLAAYQSELDSVAYSYSPGDPTNGGADNSRTINYIINDGTEAGASTSSVTVSFPSVPGEDILLQNPSGQLALWQVANTSLNASGLVGPNPGPSWFAVATGGFFAGDSSDVAFQNTNGQVVLWQVNGTTLNNGYVFAVNPGSSWHIAGTGNFYNIGTSNTDLLWQNTSGQVAAWQMNGTTIAQAGVIANPGSSWHVVGIGNFYNDGNSDVLLQNDNGAVAVWDVTNGTTISQSGVIANPGAGWYVVGTGNLYGDGNTDVLLQNSNGQVAVWDINSGTTITQAAIIANPGPTWHVVGTGDFNEDGKADIVLQSESGQIATWEMNGSTITTATLLSNPGTNWSVVGVEQMRFIYSGSGGEMLTATPTSPEEFVFTNAAAGQHTISGFNPTQDVIELNGGLFSSFAGVEAATTGTGAGALINLQNGASLLLAGVDSTSLTQRDFALT